MKKITFCLCTALFASCSYYTVPKYTKVENIDRLRGGMSKMEVNNILGIEPYDVEIIQKDGSSIITYNYKHKERDMNTLNQTNEEGLTQVSGRPRYVKPSRLFVIFDKDGKMTSAVTDDGTHNTLRVLQVDQVAKRMITSEQNKESISDSLLFSYYSHDVVPANQTPVIAKKKGGLWFLVGLAAVAIVLSTQQDKF